MRNKINILYIFHTSIIGGGSFCLLNIVKNLDMEKFNPIVLLKNNGPLVIELEKIGAQVFFEKTLSTVLYNTSIYSFRSIMQLSELLISIPRVKYWIKTTNADIVHLNTMMMYPYLLPAFRLKKQTIIHMRENWPKNDHKIQFKFAKTIIEKFADKIIAINQTSANILNIPHKTLVIYDSIDFENRDEKYNLTDFFGDNLKSYKILVFFGGLNIQKGALEVLDTFSKEISISNARLLLVGCDNKSIIYIGFKGFVKKILASVNYYSYSDRVKLIAQSDKRIVFIPSTYHIKSIIEQSDCTVSFYTIPHANLTLAESIFLGKPVIAANTLEAMEYSNNGESALLFEMNNKEEFKNKILQFLNNSEEYHNKTQSGKSYIQKLFDSCRNNKLLHGLYNELIANNTNLL